MIIYRCMHPSSWSSSFFHYPLPSSHMQCPLSPLPPLGRTPYQTLHNSPANSVSTLNPALLPWHTLLPFSQLQQYGNTPGQYLAACYGSVSPRALHFRLLTRPRVQNVLGGVLFTPLYGTLLLTALTTVGSLFATLLAKPLAPLITAYFPRILDMGRAALEGGSEDALATRSRGSAWQRLSVLRLIGVVPWSGINIACGVCGVSLYDCALGTFIGTLPWTAVTCQVCILIVIASGE